MDCGAGHAVARGTTSTKQTSRRWAAMRLLQELSHTIDPAFFRDTPEGMSLPHCLPLLLLRAVVPRGDQACLIPLALSPLSQCVALDWSETVNVPAMLSSFLPESLLHTLPLLAGPPSIPNRQSSCSLVKHRLGNTHCLSCVCCDLNSTAWGTGLSVVLCVYASGLRQRSKGPSQDEFRTATQVLYLEGRPFPQRRPSNRAQHAQQAQHTQQPQQAQHAQQEGDRRALQPQAGVGANTQPLLHLHTAQQQQQGRVNSPRGQKRFAPSEPVQALHPSKRGKHADEVCFAPCRRSQPCLFCSVLALLLPLTAASAWQVLSRMSNPASSCAQGLYAFSLTNALLHKAQVAPC